MKEHDDVCHEMNTRMNRDVEGRSAMDVRFLIFIASPPHLVVLRRQAYRSKHDEWGASSLATSKGDRYQ